MQVDLTPKVPVSEIMGPFREAAPVYANVEGLVWKLWLVNQEKGTAGGIYYFKDQESLDKHLDSDLYKQMLAHPALEKVDVKIFDIIEEFSKVTRAPI